MDDTARIEIAKRWLRRNYAADVAGLGKLVDDLSVGAFREVTITGHQFTGGQANGTITFEKMAYLAAALDVLSELDETAEPAAPIRGAITDFSARIIET